MSLERRIVDAELCFRRVNIHYKTLHNINNVVGFIQQKEIKRKKKTDAEIIEIQDIYYIILRRPNGSKREAQGNNSIILVNISNNYSQQGILTYRDSFHYD